MAGTYDNEDQRFIDRIRCIAYKEARDHVPNGDQWITRQWIADKIGRAKNFVTTWWSQNYADCHVDYGHTGRPSKMSKLVQDSVLEASDKQRKGCRKLVESILQQFNVHIHESTIRRFRRDELLKVFHVKPKPLKSTVNIEDRKWLADQLSKWDDGDFLHLAPSDEFFIWGSRKPNPQNDIIWAHSYDEIPPEEHFRSVPQHPLCVGFFVIFTARRMLWVVKEKGQSWDGEYFRQVILCENVLPFLRREENVVSLDEVVFVHDKAPCMRANKTQALLQASGIEFWGNDTWPGNSPDLNPAEVLGAIIKSKVEERMSSDKHFTFESISEHLNFVCKSLEFDTDLFVALLSSFPARVKAIRKAKGGHTDF